MQRHHSTLNILLIPAMGMGDAKAHPHRGSPLATPLRARPTAPRAPPQETRRGLRQASRLSVGLALESHLSGESLLRERMGAESTSAVSPRPPPSAPTLHVLPTFSNVQPSAFQGKLYLAMMYCFSFIIGFDLLIFKIVCICELK